MRGGRYAIVYADKVIKGRLTTYNDITLSWRNLIHIIGREIWRAKIGFDKIDLSGFVTGVIS